MNIQFATCERTSAWEFIHQAEPLLHQEDVAELLNLVEKDIVRICDPKMHGTANVVKGKNYSEKHLPEIKAACDVIETVRAERAALAKAQA